MIQFLVALALCYVLIKIPFWILGSLRGGGGRSLVGSLVRGFIAYKTFGLLKGMGSGGGKSPRSRGGRKSAEPPDPYAKTRATSNGQYMLPLNVKRVRKPAQQRPTPQRSSRSRPAQQGKQLELPLDGEWPENKPRLGRDGQYQLPLNVQRTRKPARSQPQTPPPEPQRPGPRQQELPLNLPKLHPPRPSTRRKGGDHR